MGKLHFKGLEQEIEFMFFEERFEQLASEYEKSSKNELLLPDKNNEYDESILKLIHEFESYFFNRTKIAIAQNLSTYKSRIIDYKDKRLSVLKAVEELKSVKEQVEIWRSKINSGRFGQEKTEDKSQNLYYLTKYVLYLKYLNGYSKLVRDLYSFLEDNFRQFLATNNDISQSLRLDDLLSKDSGSSEFLTTKEAMEYYKIKSRTTLDKWAADENNPVKKINIGGKIFFSKWESFE